MSHLPKQLIVLSAPSGAGKTTVAKHLLKIFPQWKFSVSATTRNKRPNEVDGKDYFFLSREEFVRRVSSGDTIEYEEIFGNLYGTLRSEVQRVIDMGDIMLFDVDVKGAISLRHAFPEHTLLIFIAPPNRAILEQRLRSRSTESEEQLELRLQRAEMEMSLQKEFDVVIANDDLQQTLTNAESIVRKYTESGLTIPLFK
jgi:guanylate kinase